MTIHATMVRTAMVRHRTRRAAPPGDARHSAADVLKAAVVVNLPSSKVPGAASVPVTAPTIASVVSRTYW